MARLEIEIGGNNSELKKILQDSKIALGNFNKEIAKTAMTNALGDQRIETEKARTEAVKLASTIQTSLAESLNNAKKRTEEVKQATEDYKKTLLDAKNATESASKSLVQQRTETEKARTAAAEARKSIAEMALANKQNKSTVDVAIDSLVGMRTRLNELRSIYDRLSASQRNSIKVQQNLVPEITRINAAISKSEQATGRFQRNVGNYGSAIGNATGVTMEFTRIIQDAPFGMMGIGNNIQQLTANWQQYAKSSQEAAAAQGKTVTTGALLRNALSSMISPAGLLTLGVSALTSGIVLYERWQQKSKKATEDAEKSTKSYIETLSGVDRARANGQADAVKELNTVEQLYKATQNLNIPMSERIKYANELIQKGGEIFKSTNSEAIVAGKASEAYDKLTNSIRQTAMAQAYMQRMSENATKILNNNLQALNEANELMLLSDKIRRQESITTAGRGVGASSESIEAGNISRLNALYDERRDRIKAITDLNRSNSSTLKEQNILQSGINNSLEKGGSLVSGISSTTSKIAKSTSDISNLTNSIVRDSLNYYDAKLFDINKKYDEIYQKVKDVNLIGLAKTNEEAEKTRLSIEKWNDGLTEFSNKIKDITRKGININSSINAGVLPNLESNSNVINRPVRTTYSNERNKEQEERFSKIIERSLRSGINDIIDDIGDLGSNFYEVFSNVFTKLTKPFQNIFSSIMSTQLSNLISGKMDDIDLFGLGNDKSKNIVAGLGALGGIISGVTKKTSTAGQIAGGALSGAAAGTAILPGWGTAIGAVVGAIGGLFSAKAAKKQEEQQAAILEEQKKQTALQQRMAALTFTSSIVGQMTNQGIVTGAGRNEFGDFTIRVEGRDLVLVYDREKDAQKRGL